MSPSYIQKSIKLYYLCNKTVINLLLNKIDNALEQKKSDGEKVPSVNVEEAVASVEEVTIENKEEDVDTNQTKKTELELLEERDEDSLTEEEEDRMYELRRLRAQKRINDEVREEEQAEFKKADEEIAHLKTLLKPKKKKLPKGYVE